MEFFIFMIKFGEGMVTEFILDIHSLLTSLLVFFKGVYFAILKGKKKKVKKFAVLR